MTEARTPDELAEDDLPPILDDPELDGPRGARGSEGPIALHPGADGTTPSGAPSGAAGGVVLVRTTSVGPRIAVLESGGVVSLPKAEVGEGMSVETAASDAALAFTGQRVKLIESIGETEEIIEGVPVTTWFWLARPVRSIVGDAAGPTAAGFSLHWVDLEEALQVLSAGSERSLVERIRHRSFKSAPRPMASTGRVALAHDLAAFRDQSIADSRETLDPERQAALLRAREEIERAEDRLDRGDEDGARRARARAERASLAALDENGRALALRRALDRAPEHLKSALGATLPENGAAVSLDLLVAVQSAVDAALEEEARDQTTRRVAQTHATIALGATAVAVLIGASFGLFQSVPRPVLSPLVAAIVFIASGALGGWVGEALHALRDQGRRTIALPMAAAAGALAGLVLGAFLTGGLGDTVFEDAALVLCATFAAGWIVRTFLPR